MTEFVEQESTPTGKKATQVADLLEALVAADGEPRSYDEMCEEAGIKYPGDLQPAMHALEIAGAVKRFTYTDKGTKKKTAYAITKGGGKKNPSSAA